MPAAADKSAKPTVEVTKQGKYSMVIGDSLKRENGHVDGDLFASVKCLWTHLPALSYLLC